MLAEIVSADVAEAAEIGAAVAPSENWRAIAAKHIDTVKLGKLLTVLTGEPLSRDVLAEFLQLHEQSEDGPWVLQLPDRLVSAIAGISDVEAGHVAGSWARAEEFQLDCWTLETVTEFLAELRALAQWATVNQKSLLLWMCL